METATQQNSPPATQDAGTSSVLPENTERLPFILCPIQNLGAVAIQHLNALAGMLGIISACGRQMINLSLFNPAVMSVFLRQFQLTALQALPAIIIVGLIVGLVTVHAILSIILNYIGAYDTLGVWLSRIVLEEVAPMLSVLIVLLRSGTATITDIGLMKIYNELDTLHIFGIKQDRYIYLPRLLAFGLAGPCLTFVFSIIALLGSFLIVGYFHNITFARYVDLINSGIELQHIVVASAKPMLMSMAVAMVAIQRGMAVQKTINAIPRALSGGMMLSVGLIILIEICFGAFLSI
jgi:phospholipid/cholesterol/gamma-HCH transport system permease protein